MEAIVTDLDDEMMNIMEHETDKYQALEEKKKRCMVNMVEPSSIIAVQSNRVIVIMTTICAMPLRAVYVPGGAGKCCSKCAKPKCFLPI